MKAPNASGVPSAGVLPSLVMAARMSSAAKPSLIAVLSFATISRGVPAGATTP